MTPRDVEEDLARKVGNIEQNVSRLCATVDHLHELLVGDGSQLAISAKIQLLWRGVQGIALATTGLIVDRIVHVLGGGQN